MGREPEPKLSEETLWFIRKLLAIADAARVSGGFEIKPLFDAELCSKKERARDKADPEALVKNRRGR